MGTPEGFTQPSMIRDKDGGLMHTGRYWDFDEKKHLSKGGPGQRLYSAVPMDFDADGDLDLLIGTDSGGLYFRVNEGTKTAPAFATTLTPLEGPGGEAGFSAGYAMPVLVDWDGDGLVDIVSGGKKGGVSWLPNEGKPGAPSFALEISLISAKAMGVEGIGDRTQVAVGDYDDDGDLDILVGDYESNKVGDEYVRRANVWLYRNAAAKAVEASAKGDGQ